LGVHVGFVDFLSFGASVALGFLDEDEEDGEESMDASLLRFLGFAGVAERGSRMKKLSMILGA